MNYAQVVNAMNNTVNHQMEPIKGRESEMVQNSAKGFVFETSHEQTLLRFLILGTDGGTYYASERAHTEASIARVKAAIEKLGSRAVDLIVEVSTARPARAIKNDSSVFALALACSVPSTRAYALQKVPEVCRIPTHLFAFVDAYEALGLGWGRAMKRTIADWYLSKGSHDLAFLVGKYQSRGKWSNADLIRLSHPKTPDQEKGSVFKWALGGGLEKSAPKNLQAMELTLKGDLSTEDLVTLVKTYNLPFEVIGTQNLKNPEVWKAMLPFMGLTALMRSLSRMTGYGVFEDIEAVRVVEGRFYGEGELARARIHPLTLTMAAMNYSTGRSLRGQSSWIPNRHITNILDGALELCFTKLPSIGARTAIALDISGSMTYGGISGLNGITPAVASAVMTKSFLCSRDLNHIWGFGGFLVDLGKYFGQTRAIRDIVNDVYNLGFGTTDCSLPMVHALRNRIPVDVFQVYTDNETYAGKIHPSKEIGRAHV